MSRKFSLSIYVLLMVSHFLYSQRYLIQGSIIDEQEHPLPFASISIVDEARGVVSNEAGKFELELSGGMHQLQLYYVGFQKKTVNLRISSDTTIKIIMQEEVYSLKDVLIVGERNPAERIIRKVINQRKEHLRKSKQWEAETYVKGSFRFVDAPEKIFGETVGGMDSIRAIDERAFIYLSEIQSILTYNDDEIKETITASKVSGSDNIPSINSGLLININLYNNNPRIIQGASFVSPVSSQAFQFYKYKYLGKRYSKGNTIHSIKIIPKRPEEPCITGKIEILDSLWMIHSFQGETTGGKLNYEIFDTLQLNLSYNPTEGFYYMDQSAVLISAKFLGFEIKGAFMGKFTTLTTDPSDFSQSFNDVLIRYDSSAMEVDDDSWSNMRKIALTELEQKDYQFKDSLYQLENDPVRLDSLRQVRNQYKPLKHLRSRYTYLYPDLKTRFRINGLLSSITYNPVQGFLLNEGIELKKDLSKSDFQNTYWRYHADFSYGFADRVLRYEIGYAYQSDNRSSWDCAIKGGNSIKEINNYRSMSPFLNTFTNVFLKEHFHRHYESRFAELDLTFKRLRNISLHLGAMYENRRPVMNNSDFSIFYTNRDYPANTPQHIDLRNQPDLFASQNAFVLTPEIVYQPGERYIDYPNSRMILRSKWPVFRFSARLGLPFGDASASFSELYLAVEDNIVLGQYGNSTIFVAGSSFINTSELSFFDYRHFSGNDFNVADFDYDRSFLLLPIYTRSTDGNSLQLNVEHNFSGYIMNKLPLFRKLGMETVLRMSHLETKDMPSYTEFSMGIDRIGINIFRPLRLDFVWQYEGGKFQKAGWVIGITQSLNQISF